MNRHRSSGRTPSPQICLCTAVCYTHTAVVPSGEVVPLPPVGGLAQELGRASGSPCPPRSRSQSPAGARPPQNKLNGRREETRFFTCRSIFCTQASATNPPPSFGRAIDPHHEVPHVSSRMEPRMYAKRCFMGPGGGGGGQFYLLHQYYTRGRGFGFDDTLFQTDFFVSA